MLHGKKNCRLVEWVASHACVYDIVVIRFARIKARQRTHRADSNHFGVRQIDGVSVRSSVMRAIAGGFYLPVEFCRGLRP